MGFPRIISKNNKIYTKLGEFCLSCDGSNFWIICHTCQEELQTQDHFWKHIQDEHNFLHSLKQESSRIMSASGGENTTEATIMPLPLYRKMSEDEPMQQQRVASAGNTNNNNNNNNSNDEESQDAHESKHYTEMRGIDPADVEIDIKVEPPSINLSQNLHVSTSNAITQSMYQLPHQAALNPAYSTVVHSMPALAMPALAPLAPPPAVMNASLLSYELQQQQQQQQHQQQQQQMPIKNENSTTASASSAVSSDDGERWYICDFESCGLKFKYQSRLELHRSVHSKERRFSCDLCGASFKQSCNLSTHRKKKHFIKGSRNLASHSLIAVTVAQPVGSPQPQQLKFE